MASGIPMLALPSPQKVCQANRKGHVPRPRICPRDSSSHGAHTSPPLNFVCLTPISLPADLMWLILFKNFLLPQKGLMLSSPTEKDKLSG